MGLYFQSLQYHCRSLIMFNIKDEVRKQYEKLMRAGTKIWQSVLNLKDFVLSSRANQNPPTCALQSHMSCVGSMFKTSLFHFNCTSVPSPTTMIFMLQHPFFPFLPACYHTQVCIIVAVLMIALVHCSHTSDTCRAIEVCCVGSSAAEVLS
jgi:hypothetical protein